MTFGLDERSSNLVSQMTEEERDKSGHCFQRDDDAVLILQLAFGAGTSVKAWLYPTMKDFGEPSQEWKANPICFENASHVAWPS